MQPWLPIPMVYACEFKSPEDVNYETVHVLLCVCVRVCVCLHNVRCASIEVGLPSKPAVSVRACRHV